MSGSFKSMFTHVTRMSTGKSRETGDGYNRDETRATRLKADTEAAYIDYRKEHEISDAEALRRLVRAGLSTKGFDVDTSEDDTEEQFERLARLAERAAAFGALSAVLTLFVPVLYYLIVQNTTLAYTTFGVNVVSGLTLLLAVVAGILVTTSFLALIPLLVLYGIEVGWFSRRLSSIVPTPEGPT